jgi:predicted ATPase
VLSEGTRRLTAILAVLYHDDPPPLLCIEEVENGLDPWTIKYLLDELDSAVMRGTQVIVTSHSPYLLNLLPLETVMFCLRRLYSVEYLLGDRLPDREVLQQRMGPGDLYANQFFHRSIEEREL